MMRKIIGWSLVTAGLAGEYFACTDMRLDLLHVLARMILVFGGVALIVAGMLMLATAEKGAQK